MNETTTTIYLIRHGETIANVEGIFRGRKDVPLNDNGKKQASDLADALSSVSFSAIYSAPLSRAIETARAIASTRDMQPIPCAEFDNIDLGEWTGRPKKEIQQKFPELWEQWITVPERLTIPGGESILDIQKRAFRKIEELIEEHRGERIAIVSHRAVLKPLIAKMLGIPVPFFWKIHMDNASYSIAEHSQNRGFMLDLLNQTCHLSKFAIEKY